MEEVVDGRKAQEEEIEEGAGVSPLLLLIVVAGGKPCVSVAQCREAGALPNPKKTAAALAVEEVVALVHGVGRVP